MFTQIKVLSGLLLLTTLVYLLGLPYVHSSMVWWSSCTSYTLFCIFLYCALCLRFGEGSCIIEISIIINEDSSGQPPSFFFAKFCFCFVLITNIMTQPALARSERPSTAQGWSTGCFTITLTTHTQHTHTLSLSFTHVHMPHTHIHTHTQPHTQTHKTTTTTTHYTDW